MASSPKPPKPVDPNTIIQAQEQANRINRVTPFGSQTYNGNTFTTTLPEGTQRAFDNITDLAGNKQQLLQPHAGMDSLLNSLMQQQQNRFAPQQQKGSSMVQPGFGQGGKPDQAAWGQALGKIWNQQGMH